jgi:hypothetical protein
MEDNLNLEELKGRLAKLGVHVSPNPIVASSGANLIQLAREVTIPRVGCYRFAA